MSSVKRTTIELAGKTYELRYTPLERDEIEEAFGGARLTQILLLGTVKAHATVLWGGMRHGNKKLRVDDVKELLAQHFDSDPDGYQKVVYTAYLAVIDSRVLGEVHRDVLDKAVRRALGIYGDDDQEDGEEGKGPAATDPMVN